MPQPIVLRFLSVTNHGHEKIPICFQQDPKLVKGVGCLNATVSGFMQGHITTHTEWFYAGPYKHTQ